MKRWLALLLMLLFTRLSAAEEVRFDAGVLSGLDARNLGSATMSGRISALDAHVQEDGRVTLYVGAASGGLWKSQDGGTTFKPVFDREPVQSIGAVTIDPSHPETVWVGTGESWTRNSVSVGNGIYRSDDGGETWTHLGLEASERISRILVDPRDSRVVFAAVPGKLWSDSAERGLYRSADGGKSWELVLKGSNLSTGCASVSRDASNPNVMFAGLWDFRRKGWTFRSGGEGPRAESGSGLYRSTDGGRSWSELSGGGLPPEPWGRVEVEVAPSDSRRVYCFIECADSALYVSSDGGATWEKRDKSQWMVWRPFYFAKLVVDPSNADRVYKTNLALIVSEDAGKSFTNIMGGSHCDWHALWVNPRNPRHLIGGDDGGLWISTDGGGHWWKGENLPISQFYHVAVDDRDPYQVYGGLQDNSSWVGDSAFPGGVTNDRWDNLYGGDGFWVLVDTADRDIVYAEYQGGNVACIDRRTRQARDIQPKAGYHEKLRFNWNTPLALGTQKGTLYIGAQFLFRSRDRGQSWERISPDLTTNDPEKQKQEQSGGITVDNSSAEMHTTIYSISESPLDSRSIWVGTDDGNVQLTRDGGQSWTNLRDRLPAELRGAWVSWVEASRYDPAVAWLALDRHTFGDLNPYVLVTRDYGQSWTPVAGAEQGLRGYAHVVREDPRRPGLLYVGTEFGLWISPDGGRRWAQFKGGNFPCAAVRDLAFQEREGDLVIGTHGRGLWIVDDLAPLRALSDSLLEKEVAFLPGRPTQQRINGVGGWSQGDNKFTGENPPGGALITCYQKKRHLFGPLKLEVLDSRGNLVDTLPAEKRRGICRVSWSMREKPPRVPRAAQVAGSATEGPRLLPGTYRVRLTKGDQVVESTLEIGLDRRADYNLEDRKAQFEAAMRVHALFGRMTQLVETVQAARREAEEQAGKLPESDALRKQLADFAVAAEAVRKKVVATTEGGAITGEERLREHADMLYGALLSYEGRPAAYLVERTGVLEREISDVEQEFRALEGPLNEALKARGLKPLPEQVTLKEEDLSSSDLRDAFSTFLGRPVAPRAKEVRERD